MEAFLISIFAVALAEIGDRTQILVLLLAARFRKPVPILLGILLATILNHGTAGYMGIWLRAMVNGETFRWIISLCFIGMGIWMLGPDKKDDKPKLIGQYGAFLTTFISFFLVEIGDKAQIAAIVLAARFNHLIPVVMGTTIGILLANIPAVWLGNFANNKLPIDMIRIVAAGLFILMGIWAFFDDYPLF